MGLNYFDSPFELALDLNGYTREFKIKKKRFLQDKHQFLAIFCCWMVQVWKLKFLQIFKFLIDLCLGFISKPGIVGFNSKAESLIL